METTELINLLSLGEDSRQKFKTDMTNADALAAEVVAFSSTAGGRFFIGLNDGGSVRELSVVDVVFAGCVGIISPGHLPNNLTIENIKAGNSNMRNTILASFAAKLLPYCGLGSGLLRALRAWPQIELIDDQAGNLFKAIAARPQEHAA
ncbi:ATP-binding protein [Pseudogulbenkiania ferrooxidans]|uniref:Putative transcriptional regulator n=1 Tax=Pseudogulbenkiania ferrooxidans 2002 TaxID=279714 RepID=B9Z870_9NEIS|nr:ATP-binding protein [Pseudogulbenkiania ferrooxidans]EEG06973.1 putative transcriptional regulator [Pseudogulbenkiania ferrooxidans 2002]